MDKGLIQRDPPISEDMLIMKTFAGGKARYRGSLTTQPGSNGKILTDGRLSLRAVPESPNPGYPLPGHVMTNAYTAPGTDVWNRFQMDDNDWSTGSQTNRNRGRRRARLFNSDTQERT